MAASFVCRYILSDKPQPTDYAMRYPGKVRRLVRVSGNNVVKSAFAMLEVTCPPKW